MCDELQGQIYQQLRQLPRYLRDLKPSDGTQISRGHRVILLQRSALLMQKNLEKFMWTQLPIHFQLNSILLIQISLKRDM
jgi:hypothetical protein